MNRTLKKWVIWQMLEIFVAANYVRNETYFFHQDSLKAILTSVRTGQAWAACCWPDMTSWTSGQLAGSPRLPSVWPPWRPWRPRARDPGRHDLNFKAYSWQNPPKLWLRFTEYIMYTAVYLRKRTGCCRGEKSRHEGHPSEFHLKI